MAEVIFLHEKRNDGGWGVIPPNGTLNAVETDAKVTLSWSVPDTVSIDGVPLAYTKGIMIRKSTDGCPKDENSGSLVLNTTDLTGTFEDTDVSNDTTYYYRMFPYSDHNVYNRYAKAYASATPTHNAILSIKYTASEAVGCSITATNGTTTKTATVGDNGVAKFQFETEGDWTVGGQPFTATLGTSTAWDEGYFGFDWTLSDSNTETNIAYPSGVDNYKYGNVGARGGDADIDLGDWESFVNDFLCVRPVMLNFDGTVAYELDHSNQLLRKDGGGSDVANTATSMNAMVEWPKRYIKRWTDDSGIAHFRISRLKLSDDFKCYPWMYGDTEATAAENDAIYMPMFEGSSVSSKCRSLSGQTPMNTQTGATEYTQIIACGSGWQFDDFSDACLVGDLMFLMGKSTNVQKHWGNGHYDGGNGASSLHTTGSLVSHGSCYGGTGSTNHKFLWMENWYGDRWERTFGVWYLSSKLYVKNFPPYTTDGTVSNYTALGRGISGTSGGYISSVSYDENGMIPKVASGSDSTYVPDGCWFADGSSFLLRGAGCDLGLLVGLAFNVGTPFSRAYWCIGPSPAYKKTH